MLPTPFRFRRFLSNLAECWIWLVNGSSIFMPIFVYTWNTPLPSPVFAWTKNNQFFPKLGRWHFGDILRVPSPCPPLLYCVLLSVYTLSSKTGIQLSQFRTGRHFVSLGLHGCEFPEPGRWRGKHWLSPCWETLADYCQISEIQKIKSTQNGWVWEEAKDKETIFYRPKEGRARKVWLYWYV